MHVGPGHHLVQGEMASPGILPELDKLLKYIATSFTPDELQGVIRSTKSTLHGKFDSLPDDDLYPLLRCLRKQGHITDKNVTMLEKFFATQTADKEEITAKINKYKTSPLFKSRVVEKLTGRATEISQIQERLRSDEVQIVNLYGTAGVGKTAVAKEVSSQWRGKHYIVDLREVSRMGPLHFKVLQVFDPSTTMISYEAKAVLDQIQQLLKATQEPLLLTMDNVEQFITDDKELKKEFLTFLERLSEIKRLKVLLTSRREVGDSKFVHDFFLEPLQSDRSQELLQSMGDINLDLDKREKMVKLCGGKPLFLKGMAAVLRQEMVKAEDLLNRIEREAEGKPEQSAKPQEREQEAQQKAVEKEETESQDLLNLKEMFSNIPSKELKDSVLALSLFRLPFTASSAAAVLDVPSGKASLLLESLRNGEIISVRDPDAKELLYDIHPLMLSFVSSIKNKQEFKDNYQAAEGRFCTIFIKKMTNLSSKLDTDYVKAHSQFQAERANFELVLEISMQESNYMHQLLSTNYHQNAMVYFLFEAMLTRPDLRRKLYSSWAEKAEAVGAGTVF